MNDIVRGQILDVPYREKEKAKELGARWDPEIRKWFVPEGKDTAAFFRWFPASEIEENDGESAERYGKERRSG